jgi:hypothetical protein
MLWQNQAKGQGGKGGSLWRTVETGRNLTCGPRVPLQLQAVKLEGLRDASRAPARPPLILALLLFQRKDCGAIVIRTAAIVSPVAELLGARWRPQAGSKFHCFAFRRCSECDEKGDGNEGATRGCPRRG